MLTQSPVQLSAIPVVGHSAPLLSMLTALQFVRNSQRLIDQGYRKVSLLSPTPPPRAEGADIGGRQYRGSLYRIRLLAHWIVVATDARAVEDIRRAPPSVLSFAAAQDVVSTSAHFRGRRRKVDCGARGLVLADDTHGGARGRARPLACDVDPERAYAVQRGAV